MLRRCLTFSLSISLAAVTAAAADWPQYRGPARDGVSAETSLLHTWPESGPEECWRKPLGEGFSGVAVAGGAVYTLFADAEHELAVRLHPETGEEVWRVPIGPRFEEALGHGPRSTPTVDGERVFVLSSTGNLAALSTIDGSKLWEVDVQKGMGGKQPLRGWSPSPLVEGDLLIVELGAGVGKSILAFDKATGETRWSLRDNPAGYSSPIAVTIGGVRQLVFVHTAGKEVVSVLPDGTEHWTHPWEGGTLAMPLFIPPDKVFVSASADVGALVLRVTEGPEGPKVEDVWRDRVIKNHWSSSVYHDGHLYGFDNGTLKAVDALTGEQKWAHRGLGKGSLVVADGMLFILGDRGQLVLAEATPEAFRQKGAVEPMSKKTWTAPSLSDGKLYLRDMHEIVCFEVATHG